MVSLCWNYLKVAFVLGSITALGGCMAVALAPVAPLVGGMMGNKSGVVIDESTVDPHLREFLPGVERIALMSIDPSAVYAAEHMETHSDLIVSVVEPPKAASPSQARRYMEEVCTGAEDPDVVLAFQTPQSDAGTGTTVRGVLTGRVRMDLVLPTDVLKCDSGWRSQFTTVGELSQGIYNVDQTRVNQILGHAFSEALLELAGKSVVSEES